MFRPVFRTNRLTFVILLFVAMLVLLAVLQFRWTGQLSLAQRAMMKFSLENSMRQFERELEREWANLVFVFQPSERVEQETNWNIYRSRYDLWRQTTSHTPLIQRLLVYSETEEGLDWLLELPLNDGLLNPVEWDSDLAVLKDRIQQLPDPMVRGRNSRSFLWNLYPETRALVHPIVDWGQVRRRQNRPFSLPHVGYLILIMNWDYIHQTMLPEMVRQYFSGPDGENLYEVAVLQKDGKEFLYPPENTHKSNWFNQADSQVRIGRIPTPGSRLQGNVFQRGNIRPPTRGDNGNVPRNSTRRTDQERTANASRDTPGPTSNLRQSFGRVRVLLGDEGRPLDLVIAAKHVTGSLDQAVSTQRITNLGMGFGVLMLLASALVLVLISSRRASRLAAMQMEFVTGVSHELRTPLSVICSVGENLADCVVSEGEQVQRYGELIRDQGRRLSEMVERTLQLSVLESGKNRSNLETLDMSEVVKGALALVYPMIEQSGFELEQKLTRQLPSVRADKKALEQCIANLLNNAVKYGMPGKWVRIETAEVIENKCHEVQVRILDRGSGIPPKEADRIFEAYYRGSVAIKKNIQGSGLGLKLARDLIQELGGRLSFESKPGQGSVFTVHIPIKSEEQAKGA